MIKNYQKSGLKTNDDQVMVRGMKCKNFSENDDQVMIKGTDNQVMTTAKK